MSYTFVLLEISNAAYQEIAVKLCAAGYDHAFQEVAGDDGRPNTALDMHGIALTRAPLGDPVACTSLADTAECFIPSGIIGPDTTPQLIGRLKIIHGPSGEDFTNRIRWVNRSTRQAHVYLLNDQGRKYSVMEGRHEVAAYEIITSDWRIFVDGQELETVA